MLWFSFFDQTRRNDISSNDLLLFLEQKIDGKALRYLAAEGSSAQFEACGLNAVGEQLLLKEIVSELPLVQMVPGRRNKKPSIAEVKTMSDMNQRIYKAK